ncbi:MAG: 50S ribosomal protein L10, partial [Spirochaetales bacterium]|nr:50S ribosomal protein L10 [Spirochaetales bacterium]
TVFNAAQVEAYSKLPGKNELLASLMGTMKAPVQNLVYAMNGVTTKLVRTLQAVVDQKASGQ